MMNQSITKDTIFDHFAGRLTTLQRKLVEEWLQEPLHRELYYEWLEDWERGHLQCITDAETALLTSLNQIDHQPEAEVRPLSTRPAPFRRRWMAVAATITLCLTAGLYASRLHWFYRSIGTDYGEVRRETLPDGSLVTLNAHSILKFPRFGFGRHREVLLTGEASFSVRHTLHNQRFVVRTPKGVDIVVLGTEFNVYARPRGTRVVLNRGKIQLNYHSRTQPTRKMLMQPGDQISLDQTGKLAIRRGTNAAAATAWQQHRFSFSATSMREIAALIKENYNLTVELKPQLAQRTVSGSFRARNANEFLQIVAELLEINYGRQGNTVTFFD